MWLDGYTASVLRPPVQQPARAARHRGLALAAGCTAAAASVWAAQHQHRHQRPAILGSLQGRRAAKRKHKVSWLTVDAVSGAVGEVASLVVLYPLDSLKVLCQARGCSTRAVLADLRAQGCNTRVLRQLYAGCGSAALCSAAIGAIYLLAFYSAKRLGGSMMAQASTRAATQQQGSRAWPASKSGGSSSSSSGSQLADGSASHPPLSCEGTHPLVASLAGVVASLAGSVFEAPMEMFKLRTQAGALDGPMLSVMVREASTRGFGSLYSTYGAFMLKSVPYDVAELATYSQMCDWRAAAAGSDSGGTQQQHSWRGRLGAALAAMPSSASDMLIGAAAGAASVLVSMPCDVIKTRMDLQPLSCAPAASGGLLCNTRAFFDTGRQIMAAGGGPGALFVGMAPRLLQTVPSTMVYWAAVEGTRRFMQQHFDVDAEPSEGASGTVSVSTAGSVSTLSATEAGAAAAVPATALAASIASSSSSSASGLDMPAAGGLAAAPSTSSSSGSGSNSSSSGSASRVIRKGRSSIAAPASFSSGMPVLA